MGRDRESEQWKTYRRCAKQYSDRIDLLEKRIQELVQENTRLRKELESCGS